MLRMCVIHPLGFLAEQVRLHMRGPTDLFFVVVIMLRVSIVIVSYPVQKIQFKGPETNVLLSVVEQNR